MPAADSSILLPSFLIVGAPKCGTTALSAAVAAHPDVLLSTPKEPHFFDANYAWGLTEYGRRCFRAPAGKLAAGEATPSYLAIPWVAERIGECLPQARIVAILRHPVERAFSSWWMFHARGMERLGFEEAIEENARREAENPLADDERSRRDWARHVEALARGDILRIRTYLDAGYYARHLRRYLDVFGRDQILVLFNEELRDDGPATVRRVWRHIRVDADAPVAKVDAANEAIGRQATGLLRLAQATGLMRLRHALPEALRAGVKRRLSAPADRPSIDSAMRERLIEHFLPHVRELEQLLAVDLSAWKA